MGQKRLGALLCGAQHTLALLYQCDKGGAGCACTGVSAPSTGNSFVRSAQQAAAFTRSAAPS